MPRIPSYLGRLLATLCILTATIASLAPASNAAVTNDTFLFVGDGVDGRVVSSSNNIDAEVWAVESSGSLLVIGGKFQTVFDRSAGRDVPQQFLAVLDVNTGEMIPWLRPQVDGPVYDIKDLGNNRVLLAGEFSNVNGTPNSAGLAVFDLSTGLVDRSFAANVGGTSMPVVRSLAVTQNSIYAVGGFSNFAGSDGVVHPVQGAVKINRASGAIDTSFEPSLTGGRPWGVAYNDSLQRLFIVGFFDTANGASVNGIVAVNPSTGLTDGPFEPELPGGLLSSVASLGNQMHDVETYGNRMIVSTKHHNWVVLDASTGSLIGQAKSAGTQRIALSADGATAYVGCHCDGDGYMWSVDMATGTSNARLLSRTTGSAGVWGIETLPNGCVWAGGAITFDRVGSQSTHNLLRLCQSANPATVGSGITASTLDTLPPSTPGMPQTRQLGATVSLAWGVASDESGQLSYIVYRNGTEVGRTSTSEFYDRLVPEGIFEWTIRAVDSAGNLSGVSAASTPIEIGQAVDITGSGSLVGSSGGGGTELSALTDGDLASYWYPTDAFYANVDLGARTAIDYIEIHESDVVSHGLGLAAADIKLSTTTFADTGDDAAAGAAAFAALRVDRYYKPVVRIDVGAEARSVRLSSYAQYGQAIDELRIFTTPALPQPAAPVADIERPTEPRWSRVRTLAGQPVLQWGGATDDTAVVSTEIWLNGEHVGTSSSTTFPISSTDIPAGQYSLVSVDNAGNRSAVNVARIATATLSSIYGSLPADAASRAIDGNTDGRWAGGSLVHTLLEEQPWLSLDLGSVESIDTIELWNRTDCCSARLHDVVVFVSNSPMDGNASVADLNETAGVTAFDLGPAPLGLHTVLDASTVGRYVRIQLDASEYLHVAEVEVHRGIADLPDPDTERPSIPTGLVATSVDGAASLSWNASTDNVAVSRYDVYRTGQDGVVVFVGSTESLTYVDDSVDAGSTYSYHLKAADAAGNTSWRNGKVPLAIVPIGQSASCSASRDGTSVVVSWDFPIDPDLAVVERSVNGGRYWWRGRVAATEGSFTDADRSGTLAYRVVPKTGNTKGAAVLCE